MRDSCITHRAREPFIMIRQDYQKLFAGDSCAAALLALVEYWANGEIALNPKAGDRVCLGEVTASDWEEGLLNFYCSKRILERINKMIERGFLEIERPDPSRRQARVYYARIDLIQSALNLIIFCGTNGQMSKDYRTNVHEANGHLSSSPYIESINKKKLEEETPYSPPEGEPPQQSTSQVVVLEKSAPNTTTTPPQQSTSQVVVLEKSAPNTTTTPEVKISSLVKTEFTHEDASAATSKKIDAKKIDALTAIDFEPLRDAYNANKPALWAECKILSDARLRAFKALYKGCGSDTMQTLVDALKFASVDSWWSSRAMTIDNLLRQGRVQEFAERYNAEHKIKTVENATGVPVSLLKLRHDLKGFFDDED